MWAHSRAETQLQTWKQARWCFQTDLSSAEVTETIVSLLPSIWEHHLDRSQSLLQTAKFLFLTFRQGSCAALCSIIAGDRLFGLNISSLLPPLVHPPSILLCLLALTVGLYRVLTATLFSNTSVLLKLFLLIIPILQGFFPTFSHHHCFCSPLHFLSVHLSVSLSFLPIWGERTICDSAGTIE